MTPLPLWKRHVTGLLVAVFVLAMIITIEVVARNIDTLTGGWRSVYALVGGIVTGILLIFIRPVRRFVYPLIPGVLFIGVIGTVLMLFVYPSNWVHLWLYLVVVSGYFMDIMFRSPLE